MALKVADWSITPGSNSSVDGVAIQEGCAFANMNNAVRSVMSAVRLEVASIGSNVSASGTPDLGSVGGALTMLGVTTVTGFATAPAGLLRTIHFETATPIVPGSNLSAPFTSIVMQKGDVQVQRSLGSGAWKVEYNSRLLPLGKHKLWIPAAAITAYPGAPPAFATWLATNVAVNTFDFDAAAAEFAFVTISMPSSWDEGTVTGKFVWTAASGSGDVIWELYAVADSNDDAISTGYSAAVTATDTLIAAGDLHRSPETSALTIAGTPAANDTVHFLIGRKAADGGDTLAVDARLLGLELYFTTNEAVDVAT